MTEHPIPTDLEAAKALSSSPAALDLFTWLSYRCFVAKGEERISLLANWGWSTSSGVASTSGRDGSASGWSSGLGWYV